jgi:ketosteroid isomerase-like protein
MSTTSKGVAMKGALCLFLSAVSTATILLAWATAEGQQQAADEKEVQRLNADEVVAFLHKDDDAMARLWSNEFVVTNPLNKFVSKEDVLRMVRSGYLVITFYDRRIEYLRLYGDTAIVVGSETVTWGGKMPSAGKTEELRFTGIWMKQQGRWQEIARHANIVPNPLVS